VTRLANLSDDSFNPFSTRFVRPDQMRYRFAPEIDSEKFAQSLLDRFEKESALAVIGPHGSGKTTLLHFLIPHLEECFDDVHHVRLNSSSKPIGLVDASRLVAVQKLVVIDGFEQLPVASRLAIVARLKCAHGAARLLVTAHRNQWFVPTFYRTRWDTQIVRSLTAEKLAHLSTRQRIAMQRIADRLADQHLSNREHAGVVTANVREYWFSLYDAYEELQSFGSSRSGSESIFNPDLSAEGR
jgi:energy-coupling factor transporter ATP-binding protein EcfA2